MRIITRNLIAIVLASLMAVSVGLSLGWDWPLILFVAFCFYVMAASAFNFGQMAISLREPKPEANKAGQTDEQGRQ